MELTKKEIAQIAIVCHEANRAWCWVNGDDTQKSWIYAENWQKESAVKGVEFAIANPDAPDSAQHDAWMRDKIVGGWVYGPVKDADKKTHPCLVPFVQLPTMEQAKDSLFRATVKVLAGAMSK
jgi:hypothetical protein